MKKRLCIAAFWVYAIAVFSTLNAPAQMAPSKSKRPPTSASAAAPSAAPVAPPIPTTTVKDYLAMTHAQQTALFNSDVRLLAARTREPQAILARFTGSPNVGLMGFNSDLDDLKKKAAQNPALLEQTTVESVVQDNIDFYLLADLQGDLEDPKNADWVNEMQFAEPKVVKALYLGDFSPLLLVRGQILNYIGSMNANFQTLCPDLYSADVDSIASAEANENTVGAYLGGLSSGSVAPLSRNLQEGNTEMKDGASDALILQTTIPNACSSKIMKQIAKIMLVYVKAR